MTLLRSLLQRQLVPSPSRRGKDRTFGKFTKNAGCIRQTYEGILWSLVFFFTLLAFPVDFALESFCCHKDDEHFVQRREVCIWFEKTEIDIFIDDFPSSFWVSRDDVYCIKLKFIEIFNFPLFQADVPPFACRFNKSESPNLFPVLQSSFIKWRCFQCNYVD